MNYEEPTLTKRQYALAQLRGAHQHSHSEYAAGLPLGRPTNSASSTSYQVAYEGNAQLAVDLLAEAKAMPAAPRMMALVKYLAAIVSQDASAGDRFFGFEERVSAAERNYEAALQAKVDALGAFERGSLDPKEAQRLWASKVTAESAFYFRDREAAALLDAPPLPRSAMPGPALGEAIAQSQELARFHASFGVDFDPKAERLPIDVIAVARRQARECTSSDVAALWLVGEHRALAGIATAKAEELSRIFAERSDTYEEITTHKEMHR